MAAGHLKTGREGEDSGALFLQRKGLRVRERNWSCKGLELDLICEDPATSPPTLVFVEVRTRDAKGLVSPAQSLDLRKRRKLCKGASLYLSAHDLWDRPCRFDLLSVVKRDTIYEVEHVPHAFEHPGTLGGGDASWQPW